MRLVSGEGSRPAGAEQRLKENPHKSASDVQFNQVVNRALRQQTGQDQLIVVCWR